MLAAKKGESTSLYRYSNVIYVLLSAVIICCLLSACNVNCSTAATSTEAEPIFAPEHIERSCIEKCPDQVSAKLYVHVLSIDEREKKDTEKKTVTEMCCLCEKEIS